jgi:Mrp family chromosome partitioning ATPase
MAPGMGVTDVLSGHVDVEDVLQTYDRFPNLHVLGAGQGTPNPTELLASMAMHRMLELLAKDAFVLVDAPPLLPVTDASLLTASADGALIVVTAQSTTTDELSEALDNIRKVRGHVLGVVLNRAPTIEGEAKYSGKNSYEGSAEQSSSPAIALQKEAPQASNQPNAPQKAQHAEAHAGKNAVPALRSKAQKSLQQKKADPLEALGTSDSHSGSSSTGGWG